MRLDETRLFVFDKICVTSVNKSGTLFFSSYFCNPSNAIKKKVEDVYMNKKKILVSYRDHQFLHLNTASQYLVVIFFIRI